MSSEGPHRRSIGSSGLVQRSSFIILVLMILALSTRMLPLSISHYPYNNDGLIECVIAQDILSIGSLNYDETRVYFGTHSTATPAYDVLLAFVSSFLGASPLDIAQFTVAIVSVLTVVCGYAIAFKLTGQKKPALAAGLFLGLFGTLVFLTGSTWKESLGFGLFVLLVYGYMKRADIRFLALEVMILALLPMVHHLVTLVSYLAVAFLTVWALVFAARRMSFKRRHIVDTVILVVFSLSAFAYYRAASFDRLADVTTRIGMVSTIVAFVLVTVISSLALAQKKHVKISFAPVPAAVGFGLFLWDYFHPLFPYDSGAPNYTIVLAASVCVLASLAWLGFEDIIESRSRYRAIPLGVLLPVLTLFLFALISGLGLSSHQVLYRSFDFADLALALGIAIGVMHFRNRIVAERLVVFGLVSVLLITFPFAYATEELVGVRHDTQEYEVDALGWINKTSGSSSMVQSDERISYIAMAMYDFDKMPYLPERLVQQHMLGTGAFYVLEDEWMTEGVNDYPKGHPIINATWVSLVLESSNVWYVGGPASNNVIVFSESIWGLGEVFDYH